jgi:hypothetical protein
VVTAIGWTLVTVSVVGLAIVVSGSTQFKAFRFRAPLPSFSSRGEEAGVPEELDDEPVYVQVDSCDRRAVAAVFGEYAREMPELRQLAREIEDLYVIEVER